MKRSLYKLFNSVPFTLSKTKKKLPRRFNPPVFRNLSSLVTYDHSVSEVYQILSSNTEKTNPVYCNFISSSLDRMMKKTPGFTAIRAIDFDKDNFPATDISVEKLISEGNKIGNFFENNGIKKGESVALMLGQDATWWYSVAGLMKRGIGIVPCPRILTKKDIQYRINDLNIRGIITTPNLVDKINSVKKSCPSLSTIVTAKDNNWFSLPSVYVDQSDFIKLPDTTTNDPCIYLYTSGTTGQPKAVQHNHGYPFFHWTTGSYWMKTNETDLIYNASDTGWGFSFWTTLGNWGSNEPGAILIANTNRKFDPQRMLKLLEKEPITIYCAAPTVLKLLTAQPNFNNFRFGNLKKIVTVGEPLDEHTIELFNSRGIEIYTGFGQAETTLLIGRTEGQRHVKGTMGKEIEPYKIKILDDELNPAKPDQAGQIAVDIGAGNRMGLFSKYVNNHEKTNAAFSKDGKYYLTRDRGVCNKEGLFYHLERIDDVIKSRGYRIGPTEVEEAGMSHPAVAKIAVIGKNLENGDCIVKAIILLKEWIKPNTDLILSIQNHIKQETSPYKYPREIEFLDSKEWSRYETYSGKIKRDSLRNRENNFRKNKKNILNNNFVSSR